MHNAEIIEAIVRAARSELAIDRAKLSPEHYYSSLPLCVIDAVFSIGVRYGSVRNAVRNFCAAQVPAWPLYRNETTTQHTISDLLKTLGSRTAEELATETFKNRQKTSTSVKRGILKAEAVRQFASVLQRYGVERLGDTEDADRNHAIGMEIRASIPGQRSGLAFDYFLMLAGSDEFVKADRWICRFVARVAGRRVSQGKAKLIVVEAAHRLNVAPRLLDHTIWNYERQYEKRKRHWNWYTGDIELVHEPESGS